jgi:HSP20 family molecular chaperone IbpA
MSKFLPIRSHFQNPLSQVTPENLVNLQPRHQFEDVMNMDPLTAFKSMFSGLSPLMSLDAAMNTISPPLSTILSTDLVENKDSFTFHVDLPGIKKEDIVIDVNEEKIVIKGKREQVHENDSNFSHYVERTYGKVSRTIPIPRGADVKAATATFTDGCLELSLPKTEEGYETARTLEITDKNKKVKPSEQAIN